MNKFKIGKVSLAITTMNEVTDYLRLQIKNNIIGYICITNSRTAYFSNVNQEYCDIQNNSFLTLPDGMPLKWIARNKGFKSAERVCGPDLFNEILDISEENGYSHYFYGSTQYTIDRIQDKMKTKYPNVAVKGAVSPPFQPVENIDIDALAKDINEKSPTFFWIGLGAPKQEYLMALLQPRLKNTICIGIGLVFEYYAGTVKRAPLVFQKTGFEWLWRVVQQPVKSKRFIKPFFWINWEIIKSLVNAK